MDAPVTAKAALLQALTVGEGFGLELIERVRRQTKGKLALSAGSTYPALRELARAGLVQERLGEPLPERGGRPRIYYKLTAEGKRAAVEQRKTLVSLFGIGGRR